MRILFLAPHPFYQDRGTPIAVNLMLQTLSERGEEVDRPLGPLLVEVVALRVVPRVVSRD